MFSDVWSGNAALSKRLMKIHESINTILWLHVMKMSLIYCTCIHKFICGASSRKPYNVGEKVFFFLADLNSPDSKL